MAGGCPGSLEQSRKLRLERDKFVAGLPTVMVMDERPTCVPPTFFIAAPLMLRATW